MRLCIHMQVAFDCVKSWMEKYVKPILQRLENQLQQAAEDLVIFVCVTICSLLPEAMTLRSVHYCLRP